MGQNALGVRMTVSVVHALQGFMAKRAIPTAVIYFFSIFDVIFLEVKLEKLNL